MVEDDVWVEMKKEGEGGKEGGILGRCIEPGTMVAITICRPIFCIYSKWRTGRKVTERKERITGRPAGRGCVWSMLTYEQTMRTAETIIDWNNWLMGEKLGMMTSCRLITGLRFWNVRIGLKRVYGFDRRALMWMKAERHCDYDFDLLQGITRRRLVVSLEPDRLLLAWSRAGLGWVMSTSFSRELRMP